MLEQLEGVEGWLLPEEALTLFNAARYLAQSQPDPRLVEIGSWKGRSTVAISYALAASGGGVMTAIDPFADSDLHSVRGEGDTYRDFLSNLQQRDLIGHVRPLRMMSYEARPQFADRTVDFLFIDGSHQFTAVLRDIEEWESTLAPGAVVAFNDYHWPDVARALRLRVLRRGTAYTQFFIARNTLFCRYQPEAPQTLDRQLGLARLRAIVALRTAGLRMAASAEGGSPARMGRIGRLLPRTLLRRARVVTERLVNGK
jgi:predicted O-methyltransferase YrrM